MRQSKVTAETLVVAPVPESLDPLSLLLAWYFISEVIRNKQLHQSGGGAPESARADPKTPPGCQVAADSADTHSVLPHNPSHCTSNEQILVLVKILLICWMSHLEDKSSQWAQSDGHE